MRNAPHIIPYNFHGEDASVEAERFNEKFITFKCKHSCFKDHFSSNSMAFDSLKTFLNSVSNFPDKAFAQGMINSILRYERVNEIG